MSLSNHFLKDAWNRFFYGHFPRQTCVLLRIGIGTLILLNFLLYLPDLEKWFGPSGLIDFAASRQIVDSDTLTLFQLFPDSSIALYICYSLLIVQTACIILGFFGRFNAACVFVLMTSFQHRNVALMDGEDNLMRIACFLLILMPLDHWFSFRNVVDPKHRDKVKTAPIWPLRLFQIQLSLVYISTAILKLQGEDWIDGTAIYYVSQLDLYQRFPIPSILVENLAISKLATWSVLAVEIALPFALWIQRYRRFAVIAGILLHLSIEYSMNLFLFQWVMIVALLSFIDFGDEPDRPKSS
ncbi:MAG: HTTM domain-containing protein [Opitutaceae bacterium]